MMKVPSFARRALFVAVGLLITLEAIYALGSIVFLNTSLFVRALGMEDETHTFVRVDGAWSPYPGYLYARHVLVAIRDQNVKIDIRLRDVTFPFRPLELFHKHFDVKDLRVAHTDVDVKTRSDRERKEYIEAHPDPRHGKPLTDEEIALQKKERFKISIPKLLLAEVTPIDLGGQKATGDITIQGGFELIPGTEAEIYPTSLKFKNTKWNSSLSNLDGEAIAQFHRFSSPRVKGSEVFAYLDASVKLTGKCENFDFLNLTLQSLEGFGFTNGHSDFLADILVKGGKLSQGSRFETPDGDLELKNEDFKLKGNGFVQWSVPKNDGTSQLVFFLRRADGYGKVGDMRIEGGALRIKTLAKILGVDLRAPFTGLSGNLAIEQGHYAIEAKTGFPWRARGHIDGSIAGATSGFSSPDPEAPSATTGLSLSVDESRFSVPFPTPDGKPLELKAKGRANFAGTALVLTRKATFPSAKLDLMIGRDGADTDPKSDTLKKPALVHIAVTDVKNTKDDTGTGEWAGKTEIRFAHFNEILDQLEDGKLLTKTLRAAADARKVSMKLHFENRKAYTKVMADSIESDGAWSGTGAYSHEVDGKWLAILHAKVLGIPVGVALGPNQTEWKILPGGDFDQITEKKSAERKPE